MRFTLTAFTLAFLSSCSPNPQSGTDAGMAARDAGMDGSATSDAVTPSEVGVDMQQGLAVPDGCNPLAHEFGCFLPYPSDVFRADGAIEIPPAAIPTDKNGTPVELPGLQLADGFSVHPSILFDLGGGLDPTSLRGLDDSGPLTDAPTLLIDTESGALVPHFSEAYLGGDEDEQIGAIRPFARLENGKRYIVAVRDVRLTTGDVAQAPEVFAALRDRTPVGSGLQSLADRYEAEVFGPLAELGVAREGIQLAWDFTVRSEQSLSGDMFSVREKTLEWLESTTPTVTILEVNEGDARMGDLVQNTFRHVEGTFTAPQFMVENVPGGELAGEQGAREVIGTIEVPFSITIPEGVATDAAQRPARFIQFGHGFFGHRHEVLSFVQSRLGNEFGFVMGAVDWQGMSEEDRDWVVLELSQGPARAFRFIPRVHQAMANQLVFTEVIKQQLFALPELRVEDETTYDPDEVYFLGISQGHILGGTFMALTPSIERGILNVGGASLGFILTRSYAFLIFERLLAQWFDTRTLLEFESLMTTAFETIDPVSYAPYVAMRPLDGNPVHHLLLQGARGDAAVPTLSMDVHARSLGIPLVTPSPVEIPAIETVMAPAPAGLIYVDFGLDSALSTAWKPVNRDNGSHEGLRRFGPARLQMDAFLRPGGMVEHFCDGPCVAP